MPATPASQPPPARHEWAARQLRQMIIEGLVAPGSKLNERELCGALQVSRTPLREAIKRLAAEGLVELLPNRGAVAATLSPADIRHSFELMAELEGMAGELAARRVTGSELTEIRALHFEMLAAFTRRDLSAYYELNSAIHRAIVAAAKNPVLAEVYAQVNARLHSLRFRTNQDGVKWEQAVDDHEAMVRALAVQDGPALRAVMTRHLQTKRDVVMSQLASVNE